MAAQRPITTLEAVPAESTFLFRVRDGNGEVKEAVLVRSGADVFCWLNYCQHFTHIKLDKGSGAVMRNGELVCENHGAYFEADSGDCTHGPCEGATLTELEVTVVGDEISLTDDAYEFVGTGPIEDGDDLTATSNVEF
ncbi:Rieske (2Fe-2S) protein [Natronobacterium gregoryi]|uniref:(2Fe-2S)-binding protein n=2 Tax=Natronobacterium gregoryi TaxID=44930 RepID=L0AE28_NATGS|nr:Rieske 2Fe-2S domain-containing protein [Natronobacterium gregoryi]AFZ72153.1 ferredoxin subunit of nitrite reductase and ring-hydroxylating dioxygenase [Natronobacterium gregoryi SP2]ELY63074.1 Rieske (2Fe-2S) iron-sulfur domain-containing protein [Natronobacterium gregoryi SP2]PLK20100.1 (2Fe-2S)-binding protein [Natronobacterium gregoryi SP2]SFJ33296.1 Ferredoxin subunit of nitrite reductase or a ring-hydroxylating dioxygenase [Natronobacterium gregoryi]